MVDMEEGRRNQIRSFFGCTLGERNEKYKKGISAFLVFLFESVFSPSEGAGVSWHRFRRNLWQSGNG